MLLSAAALGQIAPNVIYQPGGGDFTVTPSTPVVLADDATEREARQVRRLLAEAGHDLPLIAARNHEPGAPALYVGEPGRHQALNQREVRQEWDGVEEPAPGGYRLLVNRRMAIVAGADSNGTYYGLRDLTERLAQGGELEAVELSASPAQRLRGVIVTEPLDEAALDRLEAWRANVAVFDHPDFVTTNETVLREWRDTFEAARLRNIEPVPVVPLLQGSPELLGHAPAAAEGHVVRESFTLEGESWRMLGWDPIQRGPDAPIRVFFEGERMEEGADYALEPADPLFAGAEEEPRTWMIRRLMGGAIPDGGSIEAEFARVPEDAYTLCPSMERTHRLWAGVLRQLTAILEPRYVHLGLEALGPFGADWRCQERGLSREALLREALDRIENIASDLQAPPRFMAWADLFDPRGAGRFTGFAGDDIPAPSSLMLLFRPTDPEAALAGAPSWTRARREQMAAVTPAAPLAVHTWIHAAQDRGFGGMLIETNPNVSNEAVELALTRAWNPEERRAPWPEGLNAFFGAQLLEPDFAEVLDALVKHANRETLQAIPVPERRQAFRGLMRGMRERHGDAATLDLVEAQYENILRHLELEQRFVEERSRNLTDDVVDLVEAQHALDPTADEERTDVILSTVRRTGLVVPSTILFGPQLLPLREQGPPSGHHVLQLPGTPEFDDGDDEVSAHYTWPSSQGPIMRVDFETIGALEAWVEIGKRGLESMEEVERVRTTERGGVQGPLFPRPMPKAASLRVNVHAPAEDPVLRNPRVFAVKEPAVTTVRGVSSLNVERFQTLVAEREPNAEGFVVDGERRFPTAPSQVWLLRDSEALWVYAVLHEPRMDTMLAEMDERDAPLWEQEAFEVAVRTGQRPPQRFLVNPQRARYDSEGGDETWRASWDATARLGEDRWKAMMRIPFEVLGATPRSGEMWRMNFIRHRRNVRDEASAWAVDSNGRGQASAYAPITFD
ncbi:MAG: glycoside hydrolase family 20 zincin-like fold domain-containing protein [Candidatus Hydrogenedentota bacterium]